MQDLPERLSPIVVKELRQGLRSNFFLVSFFALHVFLIIWMLVVLPFVAAQGALNTEMNGTFWMAVGLALVVILPWGASGAVSDEVKGRTLEFLLLTQLSAWRIVAGKWVAVMVQALLSVTAILPYLVLRYFLGGVEVWNDLWGLFLLLAASGLVTAGAVGQSAFMSGSSTPARWMGMGALFYFGMIPLQFAFRGPMRMTLDPGWMAAWLLAYAALAGLLMLEAGSGKIAPPAENHATRRRVLASVLLALGAAPVLLEASWGPLAMALSFTVVLPIALAALTEPLPALPALLHGFARRGPGARVAGVFLYPGWPSGVYFTAVVLACLLVLLIIGGGVEHAAAPVLFTLSWYGVVFMPFLLLLLAAKGPENRLRQYLLLQALQVLPGVVYVIGRSLEYRWAPVVRGLLGFFPSSFLLVQETSSFGGEGAGFGLRAVFTLVCVGSTVAAMSLAWGAGEKIRELEEEARRQLASHPAAP